MKGVGAKKRGRKAAKKQSDLSQLEQQAGAHLADAEILIRPSKLPRIQGCPVVSNCCEGTMLAGSLFLSLGIPVEFVTVATDSANPELFNHVYLEVLLDDGSRVPFDTYGPYPGWAPEKVYRRKRWGPIWPEKVGRNESRSAGDREIGQGLQELKRDEA